MAQAFRLNPFKREIHVAVYAEGEYRRMSIVVGYQVYLDRAERAGQLDGWKAWVEGQGEDKRMKTLSTTFGLASRVSISLTFLYSWNFASDRSR